MTIEEFEKLSSAEKSKLSGVRHFTEEEINERAKKSEEVVRKLFTAFFTDILASEEMVIGHLKDDAEKEGTLSKPLNNVYQNAIELGATMEDIESVQRAIFAIGKYFDRIKNTYNIDLQKLSYAMTGENYPDSMPLKTLINLTRSFKEANEARETKKSE